MTEIQSLGNIDIQVLTKEFVKIQTDEIIVTNERISHIKERHPEDYNLFEKYGRESVISPDLITLNYYSINHNIRASYKQIICIHMVHVYCKYEYGPYDFRLENVVHFQLLQDDAVAHCILLPTHLEF